MALQHWGLKQRHDGGYNAERVLLGEIDSRPYYKNLNGFLSTTAHYQESGLSF